MKTSYKAETGAKIRMESVYHGVTSSTVVCTFLTHACRMGNYHKQRSDIAQPLNPVNSNVSYVLNMMELMG